MKQQTARSLIRDATVETETLLTSKETSKITRYSEQTLANHRTTGRGLPFVRLGRSIRYRLSDVQRAIEAGRVSFDSDPDGRAA